MTRVKSWKSESSKLAETGKTIGQVLLSKLDEYLLDPKYVEISVNRPNEIWLKTLDDEWIRIESEEYNQEWSDGIALVIRSLSKQEFDERNPILGYQFPPSPEKNYPALRLQFIHPPAAKYLCFSIRKHSPKVFALEDLKKQGVFANATVENITDLSAEEKLLIKHYQDQNLYDFLILAIQQRYNICLSGSTGSGKTTIAKSLMLAIDENERLISVEDVDELEFPKHLNNVKLFFPSEGAGKSDISAKDLLKSCLRLNPDRIMMAELRTGSEAYYYLKNVSSGHPGSITTFHGNNARSGYQKIANLIKESEEGRGYTLTELIEMAQSFVDVIIQVDRRKITGIYSPRIEALINSHLES